MFTSAVNVRLERATAWPLNTLIAPIVVMGVSFALIHKGDLVLLPELTACMRAETAVVWWKRRRVKGACWIWRNDDGTMIVLLYLKALDHNFLSLSEIDVCSFTSLYSRYSISVAGSQTFFSFIFSLATYCLRRLARAFRKRTSRYKWYNIYREVYQRDFAYAWFSKMASMFLFGGFAIFYSFFFFV